MTSWDEKSFDATEHCVELIGIEERLLIMRNLLVRPWRYKELHKNLRELSSEKLKEHLHEMEQDGLLNAPAEPDGEYELTELGASMREIIAAMRQAGEAYQEQVRMDSIQNELRQLRQAISSADAVMIGAGAGLSASAGFSYAGERFEKYFSDFRMRYGFEDMYTGGFFPYRTLEEYWSYWSRFVWINRYHDAPKQVYADVLSLVKDKEYFVLTTNVDHCFQKAGVNKDRLFYTQGDYGLFQCSVPCHDATYDNERAIRQMVAQQEDMHVSSALIPRCPRCGKPMTMNLRSDDRFVEDEGWRRAAAKYELFLEQYRDKRILFLELGVGYNTPVIIKYPFWQMTMSNPAAFYVCINNGQAVCPSEITEQSLCLNEDIGSVVRALLKGAEE